MVTEEEQRILRAILRGDIDTLREMGVECGDVRKLDTDTVISRVLPEEGVSINGKRIPKYVE